MKVRLTRKLADFMDGVDVSEHVVGDVFELRRHDADLLIAERWAEPYENPAAVEEGRRELHPPEAAMLAEAADRSRRTLQTIERLRQIREEMDKQRLSQEERRRAEDEIREELRDSRSKIVKKD